MPWRLIGFIIVFGVLLAFYGFNLGNNCNISFGFKTFADVPVFFAVFSSFVLGMFCAMPFAIGARVKRKAAKAKKGKKDGEEKPVSPEGNSFSDGGPYGIN